ncbi:MAG TPA: response regulator transcription factor [Vicinamibacterales bacterium]|nr:response regulator transcription factor [Vicinamibacterales bacterium]
MNKVRLLLVDDHAVVREGLRALLASDPRFEIVGEATDGESAIAQANALRPDIVVMDVSLPGVNGVQATRQLRGQLPDTRVVALTVHEEGGYLRSLLDAGAAGYVLKRSAASELVRALYAVADGGTYLDPAMEGHLAGRLVRNAPHIGPAPGLSDRETEVVRLVARGYSNKEIANKLQVSVKTVETYRYRAVEKLGLRGRADLVRYAIEQRWLDETYA